jgi:hypothetical protein
MYMTDTSWRDGFRDAIAANVRAAAGREKLNGTELARHLGIDRRSMRIRLDGITPFAGEELVLLATLLKTTPGELLTLPEVTW